MKTRMLLTVAFALAALLLSQAAPAAATTGYDIHFVGYCDGLHLEVPSLGLGTYTVDGHQTGCGSAGVFGVAKPNTAGKYGVDKGREYVTVPAYGDLYVINRNKTWAAYYAVGGEMHLWNSGKWAWGLAPAGSSTPSNTYNANAIAPALDEDQGVSIQSSKDIAFNGYCDGMHLVTPSAGLRKTGTVDGHRTGSCLPSADSIMGFKDKINKKSGTYVTSFYATESGLWLQAIFFPDKTFRVFAVNGLNRVYLLHEGTWHAGTPALPTTAPSISKQ